MLRALKISTRSLSVQNSAAAFKPPAVDGKTPPSIEEYNHLDPKGWQLGAEGKLLPRLPEGTKVGSLVMGKYGLYHPERRRQAELFRQAIENGGKAQSARPFDRMLLRIEYVLAALSFASAVWCIAFLVNGDLIWPYKNYKPPGTV